MLGGYINRTDVYRYWTRIKFIDTPTGVRYLKFTSVDVERRVCFGVSVMQAVRIIIT